MSFSIGRSNAICFDLGGLESSSSGRDSQHNPIDRFIQINNNHTSVPRGSTRHLSSCKAN